MTRGLAGSLLRALLVSSLLVGCNTTNQPTDHLVVYLVRHAEKTMGMEPGLTGAGQERANKLVMETRDSGIRHVLTTDFRRTRATARPTADELGLELEFYDPSDLAALVRRLRGSGGRYLVVGHSNTTHELVGLLGGEPGAPINEKTEYDRLYIVTIRTDGTVNTELDRYGK